MADSAEPVRPTSTDRRSAWSPERLTQTASRSLQSLKGYSMGEKCKAQDTTNGMELWGERSHPTPLQEN